MQGEIESGQINRQAQQVRGLRDGHIDTVKETYYSRHHQDRVMNRRYRHTTKPASKGDKIPGEKRSNFLQAGKGWKYHHHRQVAAGKG